MNRAARGHAGVSMVGIGLAGILLAASVARAGDAPVVAYRLIAGSTYQEGCFPPCECPLILEQPMTGRFDMVFYPFAGPLWTVAIENVNWTVPSLGKHIAGQGVYRRAGSQQQMRLDLQINGGAVAAFDSGWVDGGDTYPFVDITLSKNGLFCYDIALHLRAVRIVEVPQLTVERARLIWTALDGASAYDVTCGDLLALRSHGGDFGAAIDGCLADDLTATELAFNEAIEPGGAMWLLVRADGGTYDSVDGSQVASRDPALLSAGAACP